MLQASIETAQLSDIEQIVPLMETIFGPFPQLEALFTKWIEGEKFNVMLAKSGQKVIGISTWCLKSDLNFSLYESYGESAIEFLKSHKIAWAINLAVTPEHRRLGLGHQLSLAQLSWLEYQDCSAVVGSSWINGSNDNSQHLFLKAGFKMIGESGDFLRQQMKNGASCSVCKTSDCSCRSILFGALTADLMKLSLADRSLHSGVSGIVRTKENF